MPTPFRIKEYPHLAEVGELPLAYDIGDRYLLEISHRGGVANVISRSISFI